MKVYNLDHVITMAAMKYGLQQYYFIFFLEKRPMIDFSKILARAEKYVSTKKAYNARDPPSALVAPTTQVVKEWLPS